MFTCFCRNALLRRITYPFPSPALMIFVDFLDNPFGGICHIIPLERYILQTWRFFFGASYIQTNQHDSKTKTIQRYHIQNTTFFGHPTSKKVIQHDPNKKKKQPTKNTPHPLKAKDFWTTIAAFVQQYEHPPCKKWRVSRECNLNMNPTEVPIWDSIKNTDLFIKGSS